MLENTRYFIEIAYLGTAYHGWQAQTNESKTVQAELNNALRNICRQEIETIGSGRTDTGVHARQQFVHFDCPKIADTNYFLYRLNRCLSPDISVQNIFQVKPDASARFSAISRSYEYLIHQAKTPFLNNLSYFYPIKTNVELMNLAAQTMIKYEDFEAFSKTHTDNTHFRCTITEAFWEQKNEFLTFNIQANRFLRGMVRTIVGTLLEVGREKMQLVDFEKVILSKKRIQAGRSVPPQGLYLKKIIYPKEIFE